MNRRKTSFFQAFKDDFPISIGFSFFGMIGALANMQHATLPEKLLAGVVFCLSSAVIFSGVLGAAQAWILPRTKVPSFVLAVVLTSLTYLAVILIALPTIIAMFVSFAMRTAPWNPKVVEVVRLVINPAFILFAFGVMVAITFFFMVKKKLGPGVLENWILGRYYRPRQEERVFMFLDLRNSTALGETMGDLAFSRLIQMFFEDLSNPVLQSKGEVSHYIGDEAVLTWSFSRGLSDGNCLKCFYMMKDAIESNKEDYLNKFGIIPEFKAGAHLGSVVATQVGEIKSEIVFHGDVLNTTSRIQSLCNELESEFLVSSDLADRLKSVPGFHFEPRGQHVLKGKGQQMELLAVSRTGP